MIRNLFLTNVKDLDNAGEQNIIGKLSAGSRKIMAAIY